ncbi:hypothetical protein RN001_005427 [Aquatica leii]|uniref:Saccharopine dehydrogenase NADP binding domain-containing protein n=1 Tax=Aquatica leii TaxID=1421715 RepID=A0AAN7QKB9_9COLE|nr:hypothetical protein RN001_005427 [Aquatica leii]
MDNRLDVLVFGASGFTGKYTLPYVHKLLNENGKNLSWGVSGRSHQKLKKVLKEIANKIGENSLNEIPIILADLTDQDSILRMTARAKVIINCCGPYQKYGEAVVKSCIKTGTHYVDVSGESFFQETIEVKYQEAAEVKGVYIISACGFDSVATELGMSYLNNIFAGTLNSIEIYVSPKGKKVDSGPSVHYGTWESAVNGISMVRKVASLQRCRNLKPIPNFYPILWSRFPFTRAVDIGKPNKYIVPFPSPDYYVVQRTQRYFYENNGKRPIQVKFYTLMNTWIYMFFAMFYGFIVFTMCQFQYGRNLLLKYPEFFTNGYFSHSDPSEAAINNSVLNMYFYGKGWKGKIADKQNQYNSPPNQAIVAQLTVRNPGYGFTCLALALAAVTILTESSRLPEKGGVYTPAVAFCNTSYMEEIQKKSKAVEVLEIKDL